MVYVHGVVRAVAAPRLGRSPGMPGATGGPRVMAIGDAHWMVVSDVPTALYGEEALCRQVKDLEWHGRCAAVHHDALGRAMRSGPVVPLRLFTIFSSEARAQAHVRDALPTLAALFDRLDGKVEYGVQVSKSHATAPPAASATARRPADGVSDRESPRRQGPQARQPALVDNVVRTQVIALVRRLAVDALERPVPTGAGALWLDLAVLVGASDGASFVRAVRAFDREVRARGHELALTGPWPPFTFATADGQRP
jgi:hypothetical protein